MYNNIEECYQAFAHGPVISKLWLCEHLEQIIEQKKIFRPTVKIFGCWQNVLAFMMQVRKPNYYTRIDGFDIDLLSISASNKICDTWTYEESMVANHHMDCNTLEFGYQPDTVFINCSVDQFHGDEWFKNIPKGSLTALQTSEYNGSDLPWEITKKFTNLNQFISSYPLDDIMFSGKKIISYKHDRLQYNRLMIIGIK